MTAASLGLLLIWLGTIALVAVLVQRVRAGAWRIEAEAPPPAGRWTVGIAAAGLTLALVGTALFVWGRV
jgi:hypothetical protein